MLMKNLFALLLITLLTISCTSDVPNHNNNTAQTVVDNDVLISMQNEIGDDLFESPGFESVNFRTFYVINGVAIANNDSNLDYPGHFIMLNMNTRRMRLFLNDDRNETFPQTIVKWNAVESDTLKAQYLTSTDAESYRMLKKIWLNDVLVWDGTVEGQIPRKEITIVK